MQKFCPYARATIHRRWGIFARVLCRRWGCFEIQICTNRGDNDETWWLRGGGGKVFRIDTYEVERIVKVAVGCVQQRCHGGYIRAFYFSVEIVRDILQTSSSCRVAKASECNEGSVRIKRKLCRSKDIIWIINCMSGCCSHSLTPSFSPDTKIVHNLLSKRRNCFFTSIARYFHFITIVSIRFRIKFLFEFFQEYRIPHSKLDLNCAICNVEVRMCKLRNGFCFVLLAVVLPAVDNYRPRISKICNSAVYSLG